MDVPPPTNNPLDEIIQGDDFGRIFYAYYDLDRDDDGVSVDDGAGVFHSDDVDDRPIDSDSSEDELDDRDFLSQLLRHTKAEVLAASARGLPNFDNVRKSAEVLKGVERIHACPNHCILYRGDTFKDLKKCLVCSASRYKNNAGYCGDNNQGPMM